MRYPYIHMEQGTLDLSCAPCTESPSVKHDISKCQEANRQIGTWGRKTFSRSDMKTQAIKEKIGSLGYENQPSVHQRTPFGE